MSDLAPVGAVGAAGAAARIGPNAVLQMIPVLDRVLGPPARARLCRAAGLEAMPSEAGLMPEAPAMRLHQSLRALAPSAAALIGAEAGRGTADYILAHRIPPAARALLRLMPPGLAAPVLSRAIERHAWTFAGSGRFRRLGPWDFALDDNPLIRGEVAEGPLCHWHAAVFERLYRALVARDVHCHEVACAAAGAPGCRFVLTRGRL